MARVCHRNATKVRRGIEGFACVSQPSLGELLTARKARLFA